jgi:hypothetical protein
MASRKTGARRARPQRATSNVFAMFDQAQIQVTFMSVIILKNGNSVVGIPPFLYKFYFSAQNHFS